MTATKMKEADVRMQLTQLQAAIDNIKTEYGDLTPIMQGHIRQKAFHVVTKNGPKTYCYPMLVIKLSNGKQKRRLVTKTVAEVRRRLEYGKRLKPLVKEREQLLKFLQ